MSYDGKLMRRAMVRFEEAKQRRADALHARERAGVAENYIAQLLPVQPAVGGEDIAERSGQVGAQRRVIPEHFVIHRVAV